MQGNRANAQMVLCAKVLPGQRRCRPSSMLCTATSPFRGGIVGNDKKAARIAVMRAVADRLEAAVDMAPPPLDPELEKVARVALGLK
jgi:hypothetical protein